MFKIGRANDVEVRMHQLQLASSTPLRLVMKAPVTDVIECERIIHEELAHVRSHGEWFDLDHYNLVGLVRVMGRVN